MPLTITAHAGGLVSLNQPQQRWSFTDESRLMAVARFAGHMLEAITDDAGGFDLMYLGFHAQGFSTMADAQRAGPEFVRAVLQHMQGLVDDEPAGPSHLKS